MLSRAASARELRTAPTLAWPSALAEASPKDLKKSCLASDSAIGSMLVLESIKPNRSQLGGGIFRIKEQRTDNGERQFQLCTVHTLP